MRSLAPALNHYPAERRSVLGTRVGHNSIGHYYIGHNYIGHNYMGHNYIDYNYIGSS